MERVCTWVFLVTVVLVSAILAAPLEPKTVEEKTTTTATCKDGDVAAAVLFKAADMRSETDRRLKTLRAEKEVLHAQMCGDSNNFEASLEEARQETVRMIEANRRRCEEELTSIIPTMTRSVININLLEAIRGAMRTVIDAHFNPPDPEEEPVIHDSFRPIIRGRRAPVEEVSNIDYSHLCPTGVATSEALLALGEAIGRSAMEFDALRQIVIDMKEGTCPSTIDMEAGVDGKESSQPAELAVDCGDMKRVVQLYIDSFTKQLPEVGKTVGDNLLEMLPQEEWCPSTGLELGDSCYYLTGAQLPFSLAQTNCQTHGGQMAMLKDPQYFQQIRSFLMSLSVSDVWLGATDYDGDMTFTWVDGTTMIEGDWASGEPNNAHQMCAQMWRYASLRWDDDYCDNHKNVLCFKERPQDA